MLVFGFALVRFYNKPLKCSGRLMLHLCVSTTLMIACHLLHFENQRLPVFWKPLSCQSILWSSVPLCVVCTVADAPFDHKCTSTLTFPYGTITHNYTFSSLHSDGRWYCALQVSCPVERVSRQWLSSS